MLSKSQMTQQKRPQHHGLSHRDLGQHCWALCQPGALCPRRRSEIPVGRSGVLGVPRPAPHTGSAAKGFAPKHSPWSWTPPAPHPASPELPKYRPHTPHGGPGDTGTSKSSSPPRHQLLPESLLLVQPPALESSAGSEGWAHSSQRKHEGTAQEGPVASGGAGPPPFPGPEQDQALFPLNW